MILVEPGGSGNKYLEAALEFVRLMQAHGLDAFLSDDCFEEKLSRNLKFEAISCVKAKDEVNADHIIVLNAEKITANALSRLFDYSSRKESRITAIGTFSNVQSRVDVQAKIAYSTRQEPDLINLADFRPQKLIENTPHLLLGVEERRVNPKEAGLNTTIFAPDDFLDQNHSRDLVKTLGYTPGMHVSFIVSSRQRPVIQRALGPQIGVYSYAEIQPEILARRSDVMVFAGSGTPGGRSVSAAVHLMASGGVVVDSTKGARLAQSGIPILRGPESIFGIVTIIKESIYPQFYAISNITVNSPWVKENSFSGLLDALGYSDVVKTDEPSESGNVLFMPTNGIGLGHAQRSSVIASAMENPSKAKFLAFPGCAPLLRQKGFDVVPLVSKSPIHTEPYANDLMNYLRLRASLKKGDNFVFDGAYVFDSIVRCIRELDLNATWIRRGLWQPEQIDQMPLERELDFNQVIIPEESFKELNTAYSFGGKNKSVGPIVQIDRINATEREAIRDKLCKRFGRPFGKIMVTMLGGGVAADRSAQIQSLCALAETREDWLHLIVVWPQAAVSPTLETWEKSHVVRTRNALRLAQASDLTISAAGYNSFHELLYHRVPTIFMPQMAGYMDDQKRRALAASDRGLAVTVEPNDLYTLRQEVINALSSSRCRELIQALETEKLPEPGNAAAARLLEQTDGS